jgi:glycosyltransferase involved in cell wall biosynthesis
MSNKNLNTRILLIIGFVWPEPNATAAGVRMMQLIHFFLDHDYSITFACTASETGLSFDFDGLGVKKAHIKLNHSSFDDFLVGLNPDIVLFDRFMIEEQFGWRVAQQVPDALRILETQDLHSLRISRQEAFKNGTVFSVGNWLAHDTTKREIASIYRSDLSLLLSSFEIALLRDRLKIDENLMLHLPFFLNPIDDLTIASWTAFSERSDFICIGNGKHTPNLDAILWLKEEIWPRILATLPQVRLHIYGAYLPQKILQLHNPQEHFYVHGRAADVHEVMGKARVNLAPLRFGAGIKGKLADAMCNGTPSITTSIGAEGMHENLPWNGIIADDGEAFAHAAINLYINEKVWQEAQNNGIQIVNELYDKNRVGVGFFLKLDEVRNNLEPNRAQNFIGSMLRHHTMASTKYMAKWIEGRKTLPSPEL